MSRKRIVGSRVVQETPGGGRIVELILSEEAREGLTVGPRVAESAYRFHVREGDRVRMPDGREGVVTMVELVGGGAVKVASVRPDKPKRRFFGLLPAIPCRFADDEIDALTPLPSEEEILRIMDDPVELGLEP